MSENKEKFKSKIGGQALIEGIMMRGIDLSAMACRLPDGTIDVETWEIRGGKKAPWFMKVPFLRGPFNFGITLVDGIKCTMKSADKQMTEDDTSDEELSPFEKWFSETKLGKSLDGEHGKEIITGITIVLSIIMMVIGVAVLKFLPALASWPLKNIGAPHWAMAVTEGVIKLSLMVGYMWVISFMKEIHTTFMYHGAEHKTIACYERGLELTVENVREQTRFHPRCGTSFIFLILLLSIAIGIFLPWENIWQRFGMQLLMLIPETAVGYELIKLAGRYDNIFTRIISAPGLWVQRITTKEPNDKQIEVAIAALTPCIPADKSEDRW